VVKFLTNIYDPKRKNAKLFLLGSHGETPQEAWRRQEEWLRDKHIGDPQSESYTVSELREMGYVGVYSVDK
jgi:hypothetical protein